MNQEDTRHQARYTIPDLIGQTVVKALLHQDTLGDVFVGFETDQGTRVWVQADPEGNPGGFLAVEEQVENQPQTAPQTPLNGPRTGVR